MRRVVGLFWRFAHYIKSHIICTFAIALFFAFAYKYDRDILFTGDYEITYKIYKKEKVCNLSTCKDGLVLDILNSGTEDYYGLGIFLTDIPLLSKVVLNNNYYNKFGSELDDKQVNISKKRNLSRLELNISVLPSGGRMKIILREDINVGESSNNIWNDVIVALRGNGSILEEDPDKVLTLQILRDYIGYFIAAIKKSFHDLNMNHAT